MDPSINLIDEDHSYYAQSMPSTNLVQEISFTNPVPEPACSRGHDIPLQDKNLQPSPSTSSQKKTNRTSLFDKNQYGRPTQQEK
ncbi:hypothetical protein Hamer_G004767 [Homarus americanus]|uniref:Uncharacterized protein n=1 Tax=Homarus americanus TaxID=6706 RepID=A0A8J5K027_HOMAM|nr:hypothetical protein Hamer_G004767 [Homarus americanus]